MAYGYWGVPRGTLDVDVTVYTEIDGLEPVFEVLERLGARFDRSRALGLARRRVRFPDIEVLVWAAEDIALFKLLYFRSKDKVDIRTLVQVQREQLDLAYIRHWLHELVGPEDERTTWFERLIRETL
jgi:hypothetical protein